MLLTEFSPLRFLLKNEAATEAQGEAALVPI